MIRAKYLIGVTVIVCIFSGVAFGVLYARSWIAGAWERLRYGYALPPSIDRRIAMIDNERVSFLVVHLSDTMTWKLKSDASSPKTVREWREALSASLVVNGSYFTETNQPAGYYAINGTANTVCPMLSSDGNIAFGYTFLVWIEDQQLEFGYAADHPEICGGPAVLPRDAFASFPTIVRNDVSMIEKDSELKARRTMLAKTSDGEQQIIVTESGEVTLYDVAEWLVAQPEDYEIVGNLDGGPSTGISVSNGLEAEVSVPSAAVPNVIVGEFRKVQ